VFRRLPALSRVLAIYGFILGAMLASSIMGNHQYDRHDRRGAHWRNHRGAALVFAYFVGIALAGAGLGAVIAHLGGTVRPGDPPAVALITLAVIGAIVAMVLQRMSSSSPRRSRAPGR